MEAIEKLKKLREKMGFSLLECKKALEKAGLDLEKAEILLKEKMSAVADKKSGREAKEGIIANYIHSNKKIGVMVKLLCESDFVARSKDFQELAHEICLQITATNPIFVTSNDAPKDFLLRKKEIWQSQLGDLSQQDSAKAIESKAKKYKAEISLYSQPWIKNSGKTIKELIDNYIAKMGENIVVEKFIRFEI